MSDKVIEVIAEAVAVYMPERDEGQDRRINEVVKPELGKLSAEWLAGAQRHPEATRKFAADLVAAADAAEVAR